MTIDSEELLDIIEKMDTVSTLLALQQSELLRLNSASLRYQHDSHGEDVLANLLASADTNGNTAEALCQAVGDALSKAQKQLTDVYTAVLETE